MDHIIWNPNFVRLTIISINAHAIFCLVESLITKQSLYVTFVYGFNKLVDRRPLWDLLESQSLGLSSPWVILGDFNCILNEEKRLGGRLVSLYEHKDQLNYFLHCGLLEVSYTCYTHTWDDVTVKSRIDCFMANNHFVETFPLSKPHFQVPGCLSDHSPCILSLQEGCPKPNLSFKFYNMWADHSSFLSLVGQSWATSIKGTTIYQLCKKLKALKVSLRELN